MANKDVVRDKVVDYATTLIEKMDTYTDREEPLTSVMGRMTVIQSHGFTYEITTTIKVVGTPVKEG